MHHSRLLWKKTGSYYICMLRLGSRGVKIDIKINMFILSVCGIFYTNEEESKIVCWYQSYSNWNMKRKIFTTSVNEITAETYSTQMPKLAWKFKKNN